jgi:hypothetical protein
LNVFRSSLRQKALLGIASIVALSAVACVSVGTTPDVGATAADRQYLLPPAEGWSGDLPGDSSGRLLELHFALVERNDQVTAVNGARELSGRYPDLLPAAVLEAEARFLDGGTSRVLELLGPVVASQPGYVAAAVLYGWALEQSGRPVDAFAAYWEVREASGVATRRLDALRETVTAALAERFAQQLAAGRLAAAEMTLASLRVWAPGTDVTRAATEALSTAVADPAEQLASLRRMSGSNGGDAELTRRRAELEIEVGDPAAAVRLAESLVAASPHDLYAAHLLGRARFRWRLDLLPAEVKAVARTAEITRSEFAVLLYWLFPQVRYGRSEEARIATDVIDHSQREAIVRVINLGLMDVDPTVHRFEPDAPLERQDGIEALLRLIEMSPERSGCLGTGSVPRSAEFLCRAAVSCGLLGEDGDCLPEAVLSGAEALELTRRALSELGAE